MDDILSKVSLVLSTLATLISLVSYFLPSLRERRQATLDAFNRLQEQALDKLHAITPQEMKVIAQDPKTPEYRKVSEYIARIEHFAVGVKKGIYDREVVYKLAHGFLDGAIRNRIEPIITTKNRDGNDYYAYTHELYAWMDKVTAKQSRKK